MKDEPEEYSISDHPLWSDTLQKVTDFIMEVGEASLGRIVRGTGCPPDLVTASISWLEIRKDDQPVLRAMHKAPERYTFQDDRCQSVPRELWPNTQPIKNVAKPYVRLLDW